VKRKLNAGHEARIRREGARGRGKKR
jgi:hypothetical protein